MKKHPWLNLLENASLVGLGVGAVTSLILKEILYTTTPLSALVVLNLLQRRRFEKLDTEAAMTQAEVDRHISEQLEALNYRVSTMPAPETIQRLKKGLLQKNREVAQGLYAEITTIQQDVNERLAQLEKHSIASVHEDLQHINTKQVQISENLVQFSKELSQLSQSNPLEGVAISIEQLKADVTHLQTDLETLNTQVKPNLASVQEQVTRLDRHVSKLPPPVDISALRQEMGEVVKMMAELVPKRELLPLVNGLNELQQQQETIQQSIVAIETAALNFRKTFSALATPSSQESTEATGNAERTASYPAAGAGVYPEVQELTAQYLTQLRSQMASIEAFVENLAKQQKQLRSQVTQLPKTLDMVAIQSQIRELSRRIPSPESTLNAFKTRIHDILQQELRRINEQLRTIPAPPNHELVFDFNATPAYVGESGISTGSRTLLEEALDRTQQRLVLIWPWSGQRYLDDGLLEKLEAFLKQNRRLDIGWCHVADRREERLLSKLRRGWMTDAVPADDLQDTLRKLLYLKRSYPEAFQFKILGTSENFLVSDQTFAVLGIADALKTHTTLSELQLKLRTKDPDIIQRLVSSFDSPILAPTDLAAYWNRAVTRYDLGDRTGAIADYTHILHMNPDDDITYNYRGLAYYDSGDIEAALADFTQSIHLNPRQAVVYCNRGFLRSEQGDQWGAINDYSLAIQHQPDRAIAYFYRGMVWQKLDDHREAIADYSDAINLAPESAVARYYRGLAWQKLEHYAKAILDLEQAVDLFTARGSRTNAQKAQKQLTKLRHLMGSQAASRAANGGASGHEAEPTETLMSFFETVASSASKGHAGEPLEEMPDKTVEAPASPDV